MRSRRLLNSACQVVVVAILIAFTACTKSPPAPTSPEAALDIYVKTAFNAKELSARESLLALSAGDAEIWLSSLSDDEFKKQFVDNKMQFVSLRTRDKIEDKNGDVSLVYELEFKDGRGPVPLDGGKVMTPSAASYSTKKIAYLTKGQDGGWKIKATKNVKTFIERKEDLAVPPLSNLPPDAEQEEAAAKTK